MLELAFSCLASRPDVAGVIAGATGPELVEQTLKSVEWELSEDELAEVDRLTAEA